MTDITHTPIGIIHSPFNNPDDTPIQSVFANGARGEVEVFPEYAAGLKDIDGFSHLILIYHFHLVNGYSLISNSLSAGIYKNSIISSDSVSVNYMLMGDCRKNDQNRTS